MANVGSAAAQVYLCLFCFIRENKWVTLKLTVASVHCMLCYCLATHSLFPKTTIINVSSLHNHKHRCLALPLRRLFVHDQRDVALNQGEGEEANVAGVLAGRSGLLRSAKENRSEAVVIQLKAQWCNITVEQMERRFCMKTRYCQDGDERSKSRTDASCFLCWLTHQEKLTQISGVWNALLCLPKVKRRRKESDSYPPE